jgi:nucleoid DNA-binding protein
MNVAVNLYEFLKENDCAELVGLGTFYVSTQSARISSLTGEIRPPCRKLSFKSEENNNLNFVMSMAEKEFISHETALVWIKQYSESVKEKIESGKKVEIGELGSLSKDFYGNIVFEASEKLNLMDNSFAFAPLNDVKTFDNSDQTIDLIHTIDPQTKQDQEQAPVVEEEPVIIQIKEEKPEVELPKETIEHTEAVVFTPQEEVKAEQEVEKELEVEVKAEETELKEVEKEVEIEDIKPASEDLRAKAQAIIDASKEEKYTEELEKDKKKEKKKKKAKKRKKRVLLIILFILLFLLLACGGLVAAHYFGLLKGYKFMDPISEKLSVYIKPKTQNVVVAPVVTPTETIVEEEVSQETMTETESEVVLEEVKQNPIPKPMPINQAKKKTTQTNNTPKQETEKKTESTQMSTVDTSPVLVQNYSKLGCDVVGGVYKDKTTAEKKARKAKSLGYDSYILQRVQGGEQVYYVSYGSRRTLSEAEKLATKIKEKIGGDFYVISR